MNFNANIVVMFSKGSWYFHGSQFIFSFFLFHFVWFEMYEHANMPWNSTTNEWHLCNSADHIPVNSTEEIISADFSIGSYSKRNKNLHERWTQSNTAWHISFLQEILTTILCIHINIESFRKDRRHIDTLVTGLNSKGSSKSYTNHCERHSRGAPAGSLVFATLSPSL